MNFNKKSLIYVVLALAIIVIILYSQIGVRPSFSSGIPKVPEGFKIDVFAENLDGNLISTPGTNAGARMMLFKDGVLFVSVTRQGKVIALPDVNKDKKADSSIIFIDSLKNPHGIDYYDGWFYIAEENRVIRVKDTNNDLKAEKETIEVLIDNLPTGGHFTRTIKIHNNSLYLSIGSSCNVCYENDEKRAAITKCSIDGKDCKIFAKGLRNSVGIVFHPITGKMYATENGRDWLGDNTPPDEINLIEEGKNYGWPVCYGKNIHDTEFDKNTYIRNPCSEPFEIPSLINLQAHSAPLGLAFYYGNNFPEEYKGDLFVAYHGSWNRNEPTGYKVVSIDMNDFIVKDFATGWLSGSNVLGRPVDIIVTPEGELFVSDDNAGKIYRIYY